MNIISVFWFFLPAGIANMAPVLFKWLPFSTPLDFNRKFRGRPIFGSHKTWRGVIVGVVVAVGAVWVQSRIYPWPHHTLVNYQTISIWSLGIALGLGALAGDAIKSFFKRQVGIKPGGRWVPFDQLDWILGAAAASALVIRLSLADYVIAFTLFGLLHPIVNLIGYSLHIKRNKF